MYIWSTEIGAHIENIICIYQRMTINRCKMGGSYGFQRGNYHPLTSHWIQTRISKSWHMFTLLKDLKLIRSRLGRDNLQLNHLSSSGSKLLLPLHPNRLIYTRLLWLNKDTDLSPLFILRAWPVCALAITHWWRGFRARVGQSATSVQTCLQVTVPECNARVHWC